MPWNLNARKGIEFKNLEDRFHCREQTYKTYESGRRSFFKFVAKERLYYPLRWCLVYSYNGHEHWQWERHPERGFETYCYSASGYGHLGMPACRSWRSEAHSNWERAFEKHRERWVEERQERERKVRERIGRTMIHNRSTVNTFRMLAVAGGLSKP